MNQQNVNHKEDLKSLNALPLIYINLLVMIKFLKKLFMDKIFL